MTGHDILSGLGAFIGTAAAAYVAYVKNHHNKSDKRISRELDRDQHIYELITRAMIELGAKRGLRVSPATIHKRTVERH